ncbi:hypothetical protein [Marinimicrococcus flavescens]|uniref:Uncharacterized protein n=1 Tax=Marinimicrococcus flavescens TaxID=3031815 RepID=A0AAP3XS13_9PROT|nr:hypothetical protein [Marinimicrococcus flavescens]
MPRTYCFSVHAAASTCSLPRVLEVFAVHGHVPQQLHSQRVTEDDLVIDVQLDAVTDGDAAAVAKRLGRCVNVTNVFWSEKQRCVAA